MTLNDFKSIDGDRRMGIGSIPARLGVERAARLACVVMAVPQAVVVATAGRRGTARSMPPIVGASLLGPTRSDAAAAHKSARACALVQRDRHQALYVLGMLVSAFASLYAAAGCSA